MTAPALAALRFGWALLTGAALGAVYGFLRPLRPKWTTWADTLFVLAAFYGWLFLHFQLCAADVRIAYSASMVLGGFLWEWSFGRLLRPVFSCFWRSLGKIQSFLMFPFKKISKKTKILFASAKKWVTIKWNHRRHNLSKFGGKNHGRFKKILQQVPAGQEAQRKADDHRGRDRHRIVYGSSDRPASFHE